jgi:hypothetical protein
MSDKKIGDFAMFGIEYGPGIPQFLLWFQKPGWKAPVLNIVQKIVNPTPSGSLDIELSSFSSCKWFKVMEVACISGGTPS